MSWHAYVASATLANIKALEIQGEPDDIDAKARAQFEEARAMAVAIVEKKLVAGGRGPRFIVSLNGHIHQGNGDSPTAMAVSVALDQAPER
jgi:hypothetical protein